MGLGVGLGIGVGEGEGLGLGLGLALALALALGFGFGSGFGFRLGYLPAIGVRELTVQPVARASEVRQGRECFVTVTHRNNDARASRSGAPERR